ncbi:hypothetical protein B0I37DRAFT_363893 [Chaetomium sp. MPI-CAGE-AT-0009]|nr:hypothetical protein B0I37DRAFT_363893 [Chaetomium sp. MPI-CAGE-AT-0009]
MPSTVTTATSSSTLCKPAAICLDLRRWTATGIIEIQMVARFGLVPITTCSPECFDWVESLGAAAAFDYRSPNIRGMVLWFYRSI